MAKFEIEVNGIDELNQAIESFKKNFNSRIGRAMDKATRDTADFIKERYDGNRIGFKDRTGALRKSIKGGLLHEDGIDTVGVISAGDDELGSDNKPTRNYAAKIEFGEFSRAGMTAFLRPGTLQQRNKMAETFLEFLKPDNIL